MPADALTTARRNGVGGVAAPLQTQTKGIASETQRDGQKKKKKMWEQVQTQSM